MQNQGILMLMLWLFSLLFFLLPVFSQTFDDPALSLENMNPKKVPLTLHPTLMEAGIDWQRELLLGFAWQVQPNWQAGLRITSDALLTNIGFEQIPQLVLWGKVLLKGENEASSNAEYFVMGFGWYNGYPSVSRFDILGNPQNEHLWWQPLFFLGAGKYWKPFDNIPWGLDLSLEYTRTMSYTPSLYGIAPLRKGPDQFTLVFQIFHTWKTD